MATTIVLPSESFERLPGACPAASFVRDQWLLDSFDAGHLLPCDTYLISNPPQTEASPHPEAEYVKREPSETPPTSTSRPGKRTATRRLYVVERGVVQGSSDLCIILDDSEDSDGSVNEPLPQLRGRRRRRTNLQSSPAGVRRLSTTLEVYHEHVPVLDEIIRLLSRWPRTPTANVSACERYLAQRMTFRRWKLVWNAYRGYLLRQVPGLGASWAATTRSLGFSDTGRRSSARR